VHGLYVMDQNNYNYDFVNFVCFGLMIIIFENEVREYPSFLDHLKLHTTEMLQIKISIT
jgi:hypothetical protein